MLMALIANIHRDSSKRKDPFNAADFMISRVKKPRPRQLPTKVLVEMMTACLGKPTNG